MAQTRQSTRKTPSAKTPSSPAKRAPRRTAKPAQPTATIPAAKNPEPSAPRPRGKLGDLLTAVEGKSGATVTELSEALGWQPHTARAAITRLRQRGYDIVLEGDSGARCYRLRSEA